MCYSQSSINILELGAGTALPSIFSAMLGHSVLITDIKKNINLIKDNVGLNKLYDNQGVKVDTFFWESQDDIKKIKDISPLFDVIIGSELIYMEEYFDDLINVLGGFSNSDTLIILSYKIRHPDIIDSFFKKFSQVFSYNYIDDDLLLKYYPLKNKLKIILAKKLENK